MNNMENLKAAYQNYLESEFLDNYCFNSDKELRAKMLNAIQKIVNDKDNLVLVENAISNTESYELVDYAIADNQSDANTFTDILRGAYGANVKGFLLNALYENLEDVETELFDLAESLNN